MKPAWGWLNLTLLKVGRVSDKSGEARCHLFHVPQFTRFILKRTDSSTLKGACQPLRRHRGSMLDVHLSLLRLAHLCHFLWRRPPHVLTLSLYPGWQSCIMRRYINFNIYKWLYNDQIEDKMVRSCRKCRGSWEKNEEENLRMKVDGV